MDCIMLSAAVVYAAINNDASRRATADRLIRSDVREARGGDPAEVWR